MRSSICVGPFGETDFSPPGEPSAPRVARRILGRRGGASRCPRSLASGHALECAPLGSLPCVLARLAHAAPGAGPKARRSPGHALGAGAGPLLLVLMRLLGEDRVDLAARLVEQLGDLLALVLVAGLADLFDGGEELADRVAQGVVPAGRALADGVPRSDLVGLLLALGAARVGEREAALAVGVLAADQPLVLEQLEHRVDRTGARGPGALAPLLDLFDHLVAVHGAVGEQGEDGGANVPAARPRPASTTASAKSATARELLAATAPGMTRMAM